ncbi:DNA-binding NarL/FixJ family response regulator [Nocardia kruczakiae]|uniref:DNA-binding NarL/FixJ family response regulator n=1 Tax=Nocardia kruczakiae TaxID=261477 RepID=A0ABU1XH65_9NOCA|nr:response regulator transcription factor [Nocardia kruczakiae]MDR7169893.1 DNA-binding NarL/FixJ family response regulator [Nocardia kruczakiae]
MSERREPLRVLVVDDQQVMREGLVALLGLVDEVSVVGAAANGEQALRAVAETDPDVVLMDLRMPVMDGVEATRRIAADHPGTAVLVLTTYADDASIVSALRAGARGYLTKDAGRVEIVAALRAAAAGQSTFDATVSQRLVDALIGDPPRAEAVSAPPAPNPTAPNPDGLTAREAEVVALITRGLSNAEIAAHLFVSPATVKTHINNAFAKIGARNRADAVRYGYRHGLADPTAE